MLTGRFELKFLVTHDERGRFMEQARHALVEDAHGQAAVYRVSSQYFDTADFVAYRQKIDGERVRRKFRLRYYEAGVDGNDAVAAAFMEIKHRINNTVYKERVRLTDRGGHAVLASAAELSRIEDHVAPVALESQSTLAALRRAAQTPTFTAANVITYVREAWEGRVDRRLRITFDSGVRALTPAAFLDVGDARGAVVLSDDRTVMEIKFNDAIPRWVRDIVSDLGLRQQRFSKYASGLEALGLVGTNSR